MRLKEGNKGERRKGDRFIFFSVVIAIFFLSWKINLSPFLHAAGKDSATIIPYDTITSPGIEVWPQAQVIARRFYTINRAVGGERIEFLEGDRYLGLALTGGDGIGVIRYTPYDEGVHSIKVRLLSTSLYEAGEKELLIGVWDTSRPLLLVSVEALRVKEKKVIFPFLGRGTKMSGMKPMEHSVDILSDISQRYNVVYLYRSDVSLISEIKSWLHRNKFPVLPLIIWDGSMVSIDKYIHIADVRKNIEGAIVTTDDEAEIFQEEGIRPLLLIEKKRQSEYEKTRKEITVVTDWKEIENRI